MRDVMVDLETVGKTPGCGILSIGAIAFDRVTGQLDPDGGYYCVISREACRTLGLHDDDDTLAWWARQSEDARKVLLAADTPEALSVVAAIQGLNAYVKRFGGWHCKVWGNGPSFDNAILSTAAWAAGTKLGWAFWNDRCFRTLKDLHPAVEAPVREGVYHNALDDAITQAMHAGAIFQTRHIADQLEA